MALIYPVTSKQSYFLPGPQKWPQPKMGELQWKVLMGAV